MLGASKTLRQLIRIVILAEVLYGPLSLRATEKNWIAHEAQAIVVGTLAPNPSYPWFDGWHLSGVITVDEVLYGTHIPRRIELRFIFKWRYLDLRQIPHFPEYMTQKGLWFLRRIDQSTSTGTDGLGFQNLSERAYWEDYIRLDKQ